MGAQLQPEALLNVSDVTRSYRSEAETVWAARNVSLAARPGEFVCIFGASGSGKSTLLNLICGLDDVDSGDIFVGPVNVCELDESRRANLRLETVGVIFQDHQLIEEFTAIENVALPLESRRVPGDQAFAQASGLLARVGLTGLEDRLPRQLSGGQRQRVGVARALTGQRRVLLADEPTGALDSASSVELFTLIRQLCDDGLLAVVCSHDTVCQEFADTTYEMSDGQLHLRQQARPHQAQR